MSASSVEGCQGTLTLYPKGLTADVNGYSVCAIGPDFERIDGTSRLLQG